MDQVRTVADNIRALRKSAGMTQRRLAERANVSVSLLSKVEADDRPASHAFVAAVARALRVPIERVYGQPYGEFDSSSSVDALRVALRGYDLPSETGTVPRQWEELEADVREIGELRRNGRYAKLAARLPAIIEDLTVAVHEADDAGRVRAFRLLVSVYYASHGLAHRLGYADLAESIEHKLIWAAGQSGDPLAAGLAQWTRVTTFQSAGDYGRGLRILDAARGQLTDELSGSDQAAVTVYGSMHLRAVTLASRAGDAATTRAHLDAAYELLRRAPADSVHYHLTYGPANVRIHDVAASVELGEPEQAVERGRGFEPPRGMPATRAGHHYIDLAHAHVLLEDRVGTLAALESARRLAPEQTRFHPMVRETTRALIGLHRRANPELTRFTTWLGLAG